MNEQHLRIGDTERAAAAADLGEHYAQGRLTADEHEERSASVWTARTRSDLALVFADLPAPYAARPTGVRADAPRDRPAAREPAGRYRRWGLRPTHRGWPSPLVVILGMLTVVTVVTHVPAIMVGLLVCWFVAHRHGPHRRGWRH